MNLNPIPGANPPPVVKNDTSLTDILEYTAEHEKVGISFSADFEKVFDKIEHTFIFAALESFGFCPQFI